MPIKGHNLIGLTLLVLAFTEKGIAKPVPFSAPMHQLFYNTPAEGRHEVLLTPNDTSWVLTVTNKRGTWQQFSLLPLTHPLDNRLANSIELEQEVNGFSVRANYPVRTLYEHVHLTFEYLSEAKHKNCPLYLTRFRREQRHATEGKKAGALRSGIVVDYKLGIARILAIEGQSERIASSPISLLLQDLSFCTLPSALEFTPNLDVPKVR